MKIAVIELFLLPEQTLVFCLIPDERQPRMFKSPVGRGAVRLLVNRMRESIARLESAREVSLEIYAALLSEAISNLSDQVTQLVVIPHDELNHLPFVALWSGREYLGQRFTVSQLPSLHSLHYIRERLRAPTTSCVAVGTASSDPVFMQSGFEHEAIDVARRFGVDAILGADAHRNHILPLLSQADVLHLVAHGHFVDQNALRSGLRLSPPPSTGNDTMASKQHPDDNTLTATDFLRSGLNASLVVLSACQTGLSNVFPGDELEGLTRALLYAGAASIVVSLWPVDTVATREFMKAFYDSWHTEGKTKAFALQHACAHLRSVTLAQIHEDAMQELSGEDDETRLRVHVELGDIYHRHGFLPEAKRHYTQSLTLATSRGLETDSFLINKSLSNIVEMIDQRKESVLSYDGPKPMQRLSAPDQFNAVANDKEVDATADGANTNTTLRFEHSNNLMADTVCPWAAPFFWSPFVLVGEYR